MNDFAEVERLVEEYLPLAIRAACQASIGGLEYHTAFSTTMAGLLEAAEKYDSEHIKKASFSTFAQHTMEFRLLDARRKLFGRIGGTGTGERRGYYVEKIALDAILPGFEDTVGAAIEDVTGLDGINRFTDAEFLASLCVDLTARESEVVNAYFYKGMLLEEIAETFGFTGSRASQIVSAAILKMRSRL